MKFIKDAHKRLA